jgi:hypothetical protein
LDREYSDRMMSQKRENYIINIELKPNGEQSPMRGAREYYKDITASQFKTPENNRINPLDRERMTQSINIDYLMYSRMKDVQNSPSKILNYLRKKI